MQNLDQTAQGWNRVMTMLMQASRSVRECLLPALFVVLALSTTGNPPPSPVQAQDAGTGSGELATVNFQMVVTPQTLGKLCIGDTKFIAVAIFVQVQLPGNSNTGRVRPPHVSIQAYSANEGIASARGDDAPGSEIRNGIVVVVQGLAVGSTSISINADGGGNSQHAFVTVQVIECHYTVDAFATWVTTLNGANVLLTAQFHNASLDRSRDGGPYTSYLNPIQVRWDGTVNRFRGCLADHSNFTLGPPAADLSGEIEDDELSLTVNIYQTLYHGIFFSCPQPPFTRRPAFNDCSIHPDGVCPERFNNTVYTPESITIRFPFSGGTQTVPIGLTHSDPQVRANGRVTVTLTPVVPQ